MTDFFSNLNFDLNLVARAVEPVISVVFLELSKIPYKPNSLLTGIQRKKNLGIRVECVRLEFVISHREMRSQHPSHFRIIMELHELFM